MEDTPERWELHYWQRKRKKDNVKDISSLKSKEFLDWIYFILCISAKIRLQNSIICDIVYSLLNSKGFRLNLNHQYFYSKNSNKYYLFFITQK